MSFSAPIRSSGYHGRYRGDVEDRASAGDLPAVDDLQVAAAAAAAAMDLPWAHASQSDVCATSSADTDSDVTSDATESEQDGPHEPNVALSDMTTCGAASTEPPEQFLAVELSAPHDGSCVRLLLRVVPNPARAIYVADMETETEIVASEIVIDSDTDGSSSSTESDDSSRVVTDGSSDRAGNFKGHDEALRELLALEVQDPDSRNHSHLGEQLTAGALLALPALQPVGEVSVGEDEQLEAAGTLSAVLEDLLVVQAPDNARVLDFGSLLLLSDHTPIGTVEDVFGPVSQPLYALRWAGSGEIPSTLKPGTCIYTVDRLAKYIVPEELVGAHAGGQSASSNFDAMEVTDAVDDGEVYFSNDEDEAEYRRQLGGRKRRGDEAGSRAATGPREGAQPSRGSRAVPGSTGSSSNRQAAEWTEFSQHDRGARRDRGRRRGREIWQQNTPHGQGAARGEIGPSSYASPRAVHVPPPRPPPGPPPQPLYDSAMSTSQRMAAPVGSGWNSQHHGPRGSPAAWGQPPPPPRAAWMQQPTSSPAPQHWQQQQQRLYAAHPEWGPPGGYPAPSLPFLMANPPIGPGSEGPMWASGPYGPMVSDHTAQQASYVPPPADLGFGEGSTWFGQQ